MEVEPTLTDEQRYSPLIEALTAQRAIAIVRAPTARDAQIIIHRLVDAGIRVVEVSLSTPGALDVIATTAGANPELHVGVGTATSAAHVREAAAAGARFFVSPILDVPSVTEARDLGLASFPGCATPTEIAVASAAGATGIKLFPASLWSPDSLKDLLQAMPGTRCIPTGGIGLGDITSWLTGGAWAVGLGSALTLGPVEDHVSQLLAIAGTANSAPHSHR